MPNFKSRERSWKYIQDLISDNGLADVFALRLNEYKGARRMSLFNAKGCLLARTGRDAETEILSHIERAKRPRA